MAKNKLPLPEVASADMGKAFNGIAKKTYFGTTGLTVRDFIPLVVPSRERQQFFCFKWLEYGSYCDHFELGWMTRAQAMLGYSGKRRAHMRLCATVFSWFGTNSGFTFLSETLKTFDTSNTLSEGNNRFRMLQAWIKYDTDHGRRPYGDLLKSVIVGRAVSLEELNAVLRFLISLSTYNDRVFLSYVYDEALKRRWT